MGSSANQVALVTGPSRGIGASIARRLVADGLSVIVNYQGRADATAELVDQIVKTGSQAMSARADVSDPKAVKKALIIIAVKDG